MFDRFRSWLQSLGEAEKSLAVRPIGMSRRNFLAALGVSAVSVCMSPGGVLLGQAPAPEVNVTEMIRVLAKLNPLNAAYREMQDIIEREHFAYMDDGQKMLIVVQEPRV